MSIVFKWHTIAVTWKVHVCLILIWNSYAENMQMALIDIQNMSDFKLKSGVPRYKRMVMGTSLIIDVIGQSRQT